MPGTAANDLLLLVVVNTLILLVFALSFGNVRTGNWRSLSALPAFLVALFAEMYGFPLTIYLLSGWLASRYPQIDPFSYSAGQLWQTLLDGTFLGYAIYLISYVLIASGFLVIAYAWRILYEAQRTNTLALSGPYSYVRHPQYLGFILVMLGLLLAWPTLSTAIMFPILTIMYVYLALSEERKAVEQHGDEYRRYKASTPAFFPRVSATLLRR
jgi:protein-S-isoprenylcysteine O-methyltransferase Ste14